MKTYQDTVTEARRQTILIVLYAAAGYTLPDAVVRDQVDATGFAASLDRIRTDLVWLDAMDLVVYADAKATLAAAGVDVIFARQHVPGVRRPSPGDIPNGA